MKMLETNRQSRSARRSREFEQRRLSQLSIEERIKLALSMRERFAWLQPTVAKENR